MPATVAYGRNGKGCEGMEREEEGKYIM